MNLLLSEAARLLNKSESQVRYMIKSGQLPARKSDGRWQIRREDLPRTAGQLRAAERKVERAAELAADAFRGGPFSPLGTGQDSEGFQPLAGARTTERFELAAPPREIEIPRYPVPSLTGRRKGGDRAVNRFLPGEKSLSLRSLRAKEHGTAIYRELGAELGAGWDLGSKAMRRFRKKAATACPR